MSERCEDSFSNRSLLLNAKLTEVEDGDVYNVLAEYHRIADLMQTEEERLSALRQLLRSLSKSENGNDSKIEQYKKDAEECLAIISKYDEQLLELEKTKALQSLLRILKERAYKESEERGRQALEEYRKRAEAESERILQEWAEKRQAAEKKVRQKQIGSIEAEIAELKKQAQAINEAIANLGRFCLFGKRRKEKIRLEAEMVEIRNRLYDLHTKRDQLKRNSSNQHSPATSQVAMTDVDRLAQAVAFSLNKRSQSTSYAYLCHSELTKVDSVIFASFLIRAMCIVSASSRSSAQDFSGKFIRAFKDAACSLYLKTDTALFNKIFDNRTSFYDRIFMSKQGIENKLAAIIEEFEIIIKSDIVNNQYLDFSENSPLPILPDGVFGDIKCRAEVFSFYQDLPDMLSPHLQNVQKNM